MPAKKKRIEYVKCKDCSCFGKIPHQNRYYSCGYSGARMMRKDGERLIDCPWYIDSEMISRVTSKYSRMMKQSPRRLFKKRLEIPKIPFSPIVDRNGYYKPEYMEWAIKKENFYHLANDSEEFNGIWYSGITRSRDKELIVRLKNDIISKGGLVHIEPENRGRYGKWYQLFYNPNGNRELFDYVEGW